MSACLPVACLPVCLSLNIYDAKLNGAPSLQRETLFSHPRFEIILVKFLSWCQQGYAGYPRKRGANRMVRTFHHVSSAE